MKLLSKHNSQVLTVPSSAYVSADALTSVVHHHFAAAPPSLSLVAPLVAAAAPVPPS